jgi:hypothetical protein
MKATIVSALSCFTHIAAASIGYVYTHDPSIFTSQHAETRTLSPVTARLVLAQRAGVEDYHIENALSKEEIEAINDFGTRTPLFGQDESIRKAFILCLDDLATDAEGTHRHIHNIP